MLDYLKSLSVPAWDSTLETLGWEDGNADWVKIGLFVTAIMIMGFLGFAAVVLDLSFLGTVLLLSCLFALPFLFFWKLFVAAYELDGDLRAQLAASRQPKQHFSEIVAKKLQTLLSQGNELLDSRADPVDKRPPENVWAEDMVAWCTRATELIAGNLPRSEAMGFATVTVFPNGEHSQSQLVSILRARHDTLRQIATRYMEAAPSR